MYNKFHNILNSEYEKRQNKSNELLAARKADIYSKLPEISDIERDIQASGLKYSKQILAGGDLAENAAKDLMSRVEKLKNRKLSLLTSAGYPADYLEPAYECPLCRDTGYVSKNGYEKCSCHKQLLINLIYEQSNLKLAESENFAAFDETCYPDIADESRYNIKRSPREHILGIKEKCLNFIENFDSPDTKNLYFCGPAGVGKTFMANCIAFELIRQGKTVIYQPAPMLFETINEHKLRVIRDEEYDKARYESIFNAELLIIDDLGIEAQTAARYSDLLNVLNTRQSNNMLKSCKTIISTNIGIEELYEYYTERVASRVTGFFDVLRFAGEDIRRLKKLKSRQAAPTL